MIRSRKSKNAKIEYKTTARFRTHRNQLTSVIN